MLHQGHLEGCAEGPFIAPGSHGQLCRGAFCCMRVKWKAANTALVTTMLLTVRTLLFEDSYFIFNDYKIKITIN